MGFFLKAWKHFHSFAWAQVLRSTLSYSMHGCSARKGTGLSLLSTSTSKHATPARSVEPENGCWVMTWTNSLVFPLQRPCDSIRPVTKRCGKRRPGFTQNCQRRRRPRVWSCNFFLSKNNVKRLFSCIDKDSSSSSSSSESNHKRKKTDDKKKTSKDEKPKKEKKKSKVGVCRMLKSKIIFTWRHVLRDQNYQNCSAQGKKNKKEKKQKEKAEKADMTPEEEKDKLVKEEKKQLMKDAKKASKV